MGLRSATLRRLRRPVLGAAAALVAMVGLTGCSGDPETAGQLKRLAMPVSASQQAEPIASLWIGTWIAAGCVGVLVWGLIIYASLKFRGRDNRLPKQNRYNLPMEIMYTLVPFVILGVLFFYTVVAQTQVLTKYESPQHTIDVVGQKWSWTFNYREAQNAGVGNDVYEVGTISQSPTLYLPVNETVRFNLSSPDVIHSFWIPSFHFKMDIIPGRSNYFDVTPNREGTYRGKCTQLCGTYHSAMIFDVEVVSKAEYDAYLKNLAARGNIGVAKGGQYTTTIEQGGESGSGSEQNGAGGSDAENNSGNTSEDTQEGGQ